MRFRRRLYTRGSSFETTIPKPILLTLDEEKKHDIIFVFDKEIGKWVVEFEVRKWTSLQENFQVLLFENRMQYDAKANTFQERPQFS